MDRRVVTKEHAAEAARQAARQAARHEVILTEIMEEGLLTGEHAAGNSREDAAPATRGAAGVVRRVVEGATKKATNSVMAAITRRAENRSELLTT